MKRNKTVIISNKKGIHARPASKLVKIAKQYQADITLRHNDIEADAKSIMSILMLAATCGSKVNIIADGKDAKAALSAISSLIEHDFEEQD